MPDQPPTVPTAPADTAPPPSLVAGWREWVALPDLGVPWIKAKLDTGARSSALHAFDLEEFERDGQAWVRYQVHPWQANDDDPVRAESRVLDVREVRSSSGHSEERLVVATTVRLMERDITAELTLSRRDEMGFRMLVGREALRQGLLVDPSRSYLGPRPSLAVRRHNRGH